MDDATCTTPRGRMFDAVDALYASLVVVLMLVTAAAYGLLAATV